MKERIEERKKKIHLQCPQSQEYTMSKYTKVGKPLFKKTGKNY